jgi:hypothetical protein
MNAFLLLFGSRNLNVTRYSNVACVLCFYLFPFFISVAFLFSIAHRWLNKRLLILSLVNLVESPCLCAYVCHICFNLMRSFLTTSFSRSHSLLCVFCPLVPFFLQLAMLSRVLLYYSCYRV